MPRKPAAPKLPKWGYIEWFLVLQLLSPGLLFLPGMPGVRTIVRASAYLISPATMLLIYLRGDLRPGGESFPARLPLMACMVWLCASILHPDTNSLLAGTAHVALYFSVLSPVFWVGNALKTPRQVSRIMAVIFLCNALSAALGVAQTYRPDTFNPPSFAVSEDTDVEGALSYETDGGERIYRPCGLSDTLGAATGAGMISAMFGLSFALRPIGTKWRVAAVGLAFIGVAVIYYSQVRSTLIVLVICLAFMPFLYMLQGQTRRATLIIVLGSVVVLGGLGYVASRVGSAVTDRFASLLTDDPMKLYNKNRGGFVQHAFEVLLWENPAGGGLGRWGQIYSLYGDRTRPAIWVELQWSAWILDGGFPLLILYNVALGLAMVDSLRIALRTQDRDLKFWGVTIVTSNLGVLAATFGNCPFLAAPGLQFWLLAALLHAAEVRSRSERRRQRLLLLAAAERARALEAAAAAASAAPGGGQPALPSSTDR